jgi:hypothetical protein
VVGWVKCLVEPSGTAAANLNASKEMSGNRRALLLDAVPMRVLKFIVGAVATILGIGVLTAVIVPACRALGREIPGENVPFTTMMAAAVPIILTLAALDAMERRGGSRNSVGSVLIIFLGTVLFGVLFMVFTDSCGPPQP